jgi:hypothetical protein
VLRERIEDAIRDRMHDVTRDELQDAIRTAMVQHRPWSQTAPSFGTH